MLSGATVFSTLDMCSGFYQVPLDEASGPITTFITPFGRFHFLRVPMGINLGPEEFQGKMLEQFSHLKGVAIIMDDVLVYGNDKEEHDRRLKAVLEAMHASGIKLNKEKCHFRKAEVTYFGHILSAQGITPSPEKVEAINWGMMQQAAFKKVKETSSCLV